MQDKLSKKNITYTEAKKTKIESGGGAWMMPYAPHQERGWPNVHCRSEGTVASWLVHSSRDQAVWFKSWLGTLCCVLEQDTLLP